ncbi:class I SAM-dependent methyltransferase [Pelagibius litoralis]|uniref:Class I SAM-dependent methyltransferase n=1 Tax=Pelagibius litoralis TaxID=374515 RepID=A0A967EV10_9PROT|nr:class I SAM-dependent methyltransferase [Pelagibius litoralis]NIA67832.1 class I SAM-dependent methyltransferase [Pelagibius litoralis]
MVDRDGKSWPAWQLVDTPDGFRAISPRPSPEDLKRHYNDLYFVKGGAANQYTYEYTAAELRHKDLAFAEAAALVQPDSGFYLDLGFGEGFGLAYFRDLGWEVTGVDFTTTGIDQYFPELADQVIVGDLFEEIDNLVDAGKRYDLVVVNNVLEHVLDPGVMAASIRKLLTPNGIARIAVPNDGSWLHELLIGSGRANPDFYVSPPGHLQYFTIASLTRFLERHGLAVVDMMGEFPIDIFPLNEDSNYLRHPPKGRNCHFARVEFELGLWDQGIDALIAFRRGCAAGGVGRNLAAYVKAQT